MIKIKGIDVSYWQGNIDFKKVAKDGIKFAILRQGYRKSIDSKFIDYVNDCKNNDINIMVYHFIYTDGATPKQNAESTYNNIKKAKLNPENVWIAADLEYDTWIKNKEICTKEKCTKYTKEYLDSLQKLGCKKLFIYTNNDYYENYYDWNELKYPIWLADYNENPRYKCAIHQYSSEGNVNGINGTVDMDYLFDKTMLSNDVKTSVPVVLSTQEAINKIITTAENQIGYKEKKTNKSLDSKTKNAGSNNYTKYARDFDEKWPNWYNGKKNGFAWCDIFVDYCFLTAFGYDQALQLLCQPEESSGAGCKYSYIYYKKNNQAGKIPKIGAQIFFGETESTIHHTGLVYKIDNTYVYTIEGNSSNQVQKCKYNRSRTDLWYGYPNYENIINVNNSKTIEEIASQIIEGKWGGGSDRKNKLQAAGYDYKAIQTKVNELLGKGENTITINNNTIKIDAAESFNKNIAKTYKTTARLNLRSGANTSKPVITVIPKNQNVECYGYHTNNWYYVKYKNFIGFCSNKWLK